MLLYLEFAFWMAQSTLKIKCVYTIGFGMKIEIKRIFEKQAWSAGGSITVPDPERKLEEQPVAEYLD